MLVLDALRARTNDAFNYITQPSVRVVFKMKKNVSRTLLFNPVYFEFKWYKIPFIMYIKRLRLLFVLKEAVGTAFFY
ncbi:hypothetical protein B0A78_04735 [Flavobacterium columnare NBRC 100251 = ATCC 23463]|nr:hypothetical protein BU993_00885 [Flavobacterium columnare]PDS25414.1 hypothetical protein B0A78_04735 [Flavobacterium columnare NBRC 100251 = ATCC 23463]